MPTVSVCIPTYNRAELLRIAIESVLEQSYQDWELIICDDGSSEPTPTLMAQYTADPRIQYLRHPQNIGKSNNMRSGFFAATGQYFLKFDDDDRLTPDFLSHTIAVLESHPQVDFVGTDHWIIGADNQRHLDLTEENSRRWGRATLPPGIVKNLLVTVFEKQSFQVGATLFRTRVLKEVDFMRPGLTNCEDNDLFVRLALAEKTAYYLPERLMEYRRHPEQNTLGRAVVYLRDKCAYLEAFQFDSDKLEAVRRSRLDETRLLLGLRLIETGETQSGQDLLTQVPPSPKAAIGQVLSYVPQSLRPTCFNLLRQLRG
ncbi:glycosyltransferase family 2 protein [Spirulina major]|uniref:glycosyltransferase family 2 protein n=1 Tax=Spirulina major TaxID=270636 RepID=UPI00093270DE|nr:glycosyltransferase family 2 protein [Spirulina major]